MMKIGVIPNSFELPFKEAALLARDMGVEGLQPYVTRGELAPENLSAQDREDLVKFVQSNDLVFSALCADFGLNFKTKGDNEEGILRTMRMMDLAKDLGTNVITTHIGKVPEDENCEEYANMVATIERLGKYGDAIGVVFATETGPEPAVSLKGVLDKADTKSAKVNLDRAKLFMCAGENPLHSVRVLGDYIAHTHAKDGQMNADGSYTEYPLGKGGVPFKEYIGALKLIGYDGFLTIEREGGASRMDDIRNGVQLLRSILNELY